MHSSHYQPKRSQHLFLRDQIIQVYGKRSVAERVIVHHVIKDTTTEMIVQIERQCPEYGVSFERVKL